MELFKQICILCTCMSCCYSQNTILLKNINIVKTNSYKIVKSQNVLINNGKIDIISGKSINPKTNNVKIIDGSKKFLIEGYTDMHAHLPSTDTSWDMDYYFKLNLINGITRIRSMRGNLDETALRDSINSNQKIGPKLIVGFTFGKVNNVNDVIRDYNDGKYDFIKYLGGLSLAQFDSINKISYASKVQILGHIHKSGLLNTLQYNYKSIEHFPSFTDSMILFTNKIDTLMKNKELYLCPTLHYYFINWDRIEKKTLLEYPELKFVPSSVRNKWIKKINSYYQDEVEKDRLKFINDSILNSVKINNFAIHRNKLFKNNIKLIIGSDQNLFIVPGFSFHRELKCLKDLGFSNKEVFNFLFKNSSDYFNENREKIKENNSPDLLILKTNPLKDITNLKYIDALILKGKFYLIKDLEVN